MLNNAASRGGSVPSEPRDLASSGHQGGEPWSAWEQRAPAHNDGLVQLLRHWDSIIETNTTPDTGSAKASPGGETVAPCLPEGRITSSSHRAGAELVPHSLASRRGKDKTRAGTRRAPSTGSHGRSKDSNTESNKTSSREPPQPAKVECGVCEFQGSKEEVINHHKSDHPRCVLCIFEYMWLSASGSQNRGHRKAKKSKEEVLENVQGLLKRYKDAQILRHHIDRHIPALQCPNYRYRGPQRGCSFLCSRKADLERHTCDDCNLSFEQVKVQKRLCEQVQRSVDQHKNSARDLEDSLMKILFFEDEQGYAKGYFDQLGRSGHVNNLDHHPETRASLESSSVQEQIAEHIFQCSTKLTPERRAQVANHLLSYQKDCEFQPCDSRIQKSLPMRSFIETYGSFEDASVFRELPAAGTGSESEAVRSPKRVKVDEASPRRARSSATVARPAFVVPEGPSSAVPSAEQRPASAVDALPPVEAVSPLMATTLEQNPLVAVGSTLPNTQGLSSSICISESLLSTQSDTAPYPAELSRGVDPSQMDSGQSQDFTFANPALGTYQDFDDTSSSTSILAYLCLPTEDSVYGGDEMGDFGS